ncbi:hypothetical protein [Streptomyces albidoflavus]
MRRRSLLAATATVPAAMLLGMDRALADTPPPTGRGALDARVASARDLYDKGPTRSSSGCCRASWPTGTPLPPRAASWTRPGCPPSTA